ALARARDDLRRAAEERLRALPARREAARLPQPHRRPRVGAVDEGPAAEGLLRERAARRDGGRHARSVRDLLRHDRRAGVCVGERRRLVGADRQPPAARAVRRSADDPMIRVVLPQHLRTLAGGDGEGLPALDAPATQASDPRAVDTLDPCGIYFGTTGGQVYASANGGDSWEPIVSHLPPVLSVEVQTIR